MTGRRLRRLCVGLGVALALVAIVVPLTSVPGAVQYVPLNVSLGLSFVIAGAIAWARRPENRTGLLMMLTGLVWLEARAFGWWDAPLPQQVSQVSLNLMLALLAHLVIVFPHGRTRSQNERLLVGAAYTLTVVGWAAPMLFYDPRIEGCPDCPRNLLLAHGDHAEYTIATAATNLLTIALAATIVARLVGRWWLASPPGRRALTPIVCVAPVVGVVAVVIFAENGLGLIDLPQRVLNWAALVYAAVPIAFLVGLLRTRLHRTALGELVVELSEAPSPDRVQAALSRALGDPSLRVAYWVTDLGRYVDGEGAPLELAARGDRATTVLEQDGEVLAALEYDPSLLEDAAFVQAAGAAARLALANARLQAELQAQLAAVRASRARIVEAGDAERRRLERDLHDGAQQRLLAIRLALQLARGPTGDSAERDALLAEADAELQGTLDELRALARGIHPTILTDEGLAAALETLMRRSPVPVSIEALPAARLPAPVEAAAYFVASEALANITKHARASRVTIGVAHTGGRLVIDVSDDGVGGADTGGSGLVGMRDRVEALDGRLRIASPSGCGTSLHAEIPCA